MVAKDASPGEAPWPEVRTGGLGPLYGLFGEEDFLVSQALEAFVACPDFLPNPQLNIERFSAQDAVPARVLESACTLPFLGSRRMVLVQETHFYKAEQQNEFLAYLEDPSPGTCLVFAGLRLDSRTKFGKSLAKLGKVQIFKKMYPRQLIPWLRQRAQLRGKKLGGQVAERLSELAGLGLSSLDWELEKLSLYVGRRASIEMEDFAAVTGQSRVYGIFDFTDALAAGRLDRTLSCYAQLESLGEAAVRVLAMVTRLFRQLMEVRRVLDQGGGEDQVQRALRIPPSATHTLVGRARRESAASLRQGLVRIMEAERALKSLPGSDRVIMEALVMDLCPPAGGGAGRRA